MISFKSSFVISLFQKSGIPVEHIDFSAAFAKNIDGTGVNKLKTIEYVIFPRLDWSDRYLDTIMQSKKQIPRKIVIAATMTCKD